MATTVVYGDVADGYIVASGATTYADARTASGTATVTAQDGPSTPFLIIHQEQGAGGGAFACYESFVSFDTTALSGAAVGQVSLSLFGTNLSTPTAFDVNVRTDDWGTSLTTADWVSGASLSALALCASLNTASISTSAYNAFVSANALRTSVGGTVRLIMASSRMEAGTAPGIGVVEDVEFASADAAGTTTDPFLSIYTGVVVRLTGALGSAVTANLSLAYPTTISAGDRFVAVITAQDNVVSSLTSWTLKQGTNNGSGLRTEIFTKDAAATGSETGSVTFTRSSGLASEGRIFAIAGALASGDPIEAIAASANASSSTVTQPSLTTLTDGALVIEVASLAGVGTTSTYTGTDPTFVEESDDSFDPRPTLVTTTAVSSSAAGTGFTLPIPATVAVGDLVVLAVTTKSATSTTVTRSSGGGSTNPWTALRAVQLNLSSSATATTLYYVHIIEAADISASVVFAYTGGSVKFAAIASYWRNAALLASQPNTSAAQANATASTATLPTVTPSVANTVEIAIAGCGSVAVISTITGFLLPTTSSATGSGGAGSTQCGVSMAYKLYPASGGATGTSTVNLSTTSAGCATAHIVIAPLSATSNPISQAVADDNKTIAGTLSGLTATASIAAVNTGVLFAIAPPVAVFPKAIRRLVQAVKRAAFF